MVIQFGFCTIYVASFPLAPLMALLNNIIEIRLDAFKFVNLKRRVPVEMAKNIGAWEKILAVLAAVALIANALVAGFTSDMIPKFVYAKSYGPCGDEPGFGMTRWMRNECLEGYSDWSLQAVHVSQLDYGSYGFVDGKRATLFDLYNSEKFKKRENAFKFHNLVKDDIKLT